jgi:hypothetical protein
MSYTPTTSQAGTEISITGRSGTFEKLTRGQGSRCGGYGLYFDKSAEEAVRTVKSTPRRLEKGVASTPAQRYAVGRHIETALREAGRMVEAAEHADLIGLGTAGLDLKDSLQELWKLRDVREDEWSAVVNFLQSALSKATIERFSSEQCSITCKVLKDYVAGGAVRDEDVMDARRLLREAGLDPWAGIEVTPEDM